MGQEREKDDTFNLDYTEKAINEYAEKLKDTRLKDLPVPVKKVLIRLLVKGLLLITLVILVIYFITTFALMPVDKEESKLVSVYKVVEPNNNSNTYTTYFLDADTEELYSTDTKIIYDVCNNAIGKEAYIYVTTYKLPFNKKRYVITKVIPLWD